MSTYKMISADDLFNEVFEVIDFTEKKEEDDRPIVLLAGGIHGNEIRGIEAVSKFVDALKNSSDDESSIFAKILSSVRLYVIPALNVVGKLAGARCCPFSGELIKYDEEQKLVIVEQNEKGSIRIPTGWADPNRLWNENKTLAKIHLARVIKSLPRKPDLVIFPHDWAATQPIVKIYESTNTNFAAQVKDSQALLEKYYPSRTPFGKQWNFVRTAQQEEDFENLSWELLVQEGIPSFVVETYLHAEKSVLVHYQLLLFILSTFSTTNSLELVKQAQSSNF